MRTVVIPMAGLGIRFKPIHETKPLCPIAPSNKPMFVHAVESLGFSFDRLILISLAELDLRRNAAEHLAALGAELVELPEVTRGPADTVLRARHLLRETLNEEIIVCNCDQVMVWPGDWALNWFRTRGAAGGIPTLERQSQRHSYCLIDEVIPHKVNKVREKKRVSSRASIGVYWFREIGAFLHAADRMMAAGDTAPNGEFYVGPVYNYLDGLILEYPLCEFWSLGEPENLRAYQARDYTVAMRD
jgi:NDP-sugar pyrophosphorylase family protein